MAKTTRGGYDGKGQAVLRQAADAERAWDDLRADEVLVEAWAGFEAELSVVVARGVTGGIRTYGPLRNVHADHILDTVVYPAGFDAPLEEEAREIGRAVAEAVDLAGVLCVEMFAMPGGRLWINELAPRPHNSGHLTIEAFDTSQFEQQVRAMTGMPLGAAEARVPAAAMANLLGRHLPSSDIAQAWRCADAVPKTSWHLYGKDGRARDRKMGHVVATGTTPAAALDAVTRARDLLRTPDPGG